MGNLVRVVMCSSPKTDNCARHRCKFTARHQTGRKALATLYTWSRQSTPVANGEHSHRSSRQSSKSGYIAPIWGRKARKH